MFKGMFTSALTIIFFLTSLCAEAKKINLIRQTQNPNFGDLPVRSLKATSTGILELGWPLYAVDVDFPDLSDDFNPNNGGDTHGLMGIALYTNESFFGGDCDSYLKYSCNRSNCFPTPDNKRNVTLPYLTIEGYTTHTELYIDYSFFSSNYMDVTYSQICTSNNFDPNVGMTYGNIGLGLDGYGINNYLNEEPRFSVNLADNGLSGELVFDCDSTKINATGFSATSDASKNWEISSQIMNIDQMNVLFDGNTIFDLNTAAIGLPEQLYIAMVNYLNEVYNVTCYDPDVSLLGCVYDGNYLKLPPVNIGDGVMIPPQVYLHPLQDNVYDLMVVALSTNASSDLPNIQVTDKYKNYVILGAPFLQHFYVCFEGRPEVTQISIYEKAQNGVNEQTILNNICLGVAIGIPTLLFLYFCCVASRKRNDPRQTDVIKDSFINDNVVHSENDFIQIKNSMQGMRKSHVVPSYGRSKTYTAFEELSTKKTSEETNITFSFVESPELLRVDIK